jgi:hypothetical protein
MPRDFAPVGLTNPAGWVYIDGAAVSAGAAGSQALELAQNRFGTMRLMICVCFLFFQSAGDQEGTRSYGRDGH